MTEAPLVVLRRVLEHLDAAGPGITAGYEATTPHSSHAGELTRAAVELSAAAAALAGLARRITADITTAADPRSDPRPEAVAELSCLRGGCGQPATVRMAETIGTYGAFIGAMLSDLLGLSPEPPAGELELCTEHAGQHAVRMVDVAVVKWCAPVTVTLAPIGGAR